MSDQQQRFSSPFSSQGSAGETELMPISSGDSRSDGSRKFENEGPAYRLCPWIKAGSRSHRACRWAGAVFCALFLIAVLILPLLLREPDEECEETHLGGRDAPVCEGSVAAVAADNADCSVIGTDMLQLGGNAVDAAVATALCLGVMNPWSSGIGGGAFIMVHETDGDVRFLDARERAPGAAYRDMYIDDSGYDSLNGGSAVATPGEVMGLHTAWSEYGVLPWATLVEPAATLASECYPAHDHLIKVITGLEDTIYANEGLSDIFTKEDGGETVLLELGDPVCMPTLGETLQTIGSTGVDSFYFGEIAQGIANDVQADNGLITTDDMSNYTAVWRDPVEGFFQGFGLYGPAPPSSGGSTVILALNILERFQLGMDGYSGLAVHRLVEAMKHSFAARMGLGDPDFVPMHDYVQEMVSKQYAAAVRASISDSATFESEEYTEKSLLEGGEGVAIAVDGGTTHFSVVDQDGMGVAITSTINMYFGSKLVSESTGIFLNNEMDDFSSPNQTNGFGLAPHESNFIEPYKRPLSSMSPTFVTRDGALFAAVGASGGPRIITHTIQTVLRMLEFEMGLKDAIGGPLVHHQLYPNYVLYETDLSSCVVDTLRDNGHVLEPLSEGSLMAVEQGVVVNEGIRFTSSLDWEEREVHAGSDWRKGGSPSCI